MILGNDVINGTSQTGTGTLTLAACPTPPGGLDFFAWLTATGLNFVNGSAVLVSYAIVEYTDSTFATEKQKEMGVGTITLGASLTATTLARTTIKEKITSLDSQPATPTYAAPTAINIGTAANTLIFIGPNVHDTQTTSPYYELTLGDVGYVCPRSNGGATGAQAALSSGYAVYQLIDHPIPLLAKRAAVNLAVAYTGGTSNLYLRLYDIGADGRPGKLLYDFGVCGTINSSLSATGLVTTGASGNGFLMRPREYYIATICAFSGGSGSPSLRGFNAATNSNCISSGRVGSGWAGSTPLLPYGGSFAGNGALTPSTVSDPANQTSYALNTLTYQNFLCGFKAS